MGAETPLKVSLVRCAPIVGLLLKGPNKELHKLAVGANSDSSYAKSESLCAP